MRGRGEITEQFEIILVTFQLPGIIFHRSPRQQTGHREPASFTKNYVRKEVVVEHVQYFGSVVVFRRCFDGVPCVFVGFQATGQFEFANFLDQLCVHEKAGLVEYREIGGQRSLDIIATEVSQRHVERNCVIR